MIAIFKSFEKTFTHPEYIFVRKNDAYIKSWSSASHCEQEIARILVPMFHSSITQNSEVLL